MLAASVRWGRSDTVARRDGLLSSYFRVLGLLLSVIIVQAVVEVGLIALLYGDLLFAPYRFFSLQVFDGFTKIYQLAGRVLPLPQLLDRFAGVGVLAKLALLPDFVAAGGLVCVPFAAVLLPFVGRAGKAGGRKRVLVGCGLLLSAVHLSFWLANVKIPAEPTLRLVLGNLLRDAVFDGVAPALGVGALSLGLVWLWPLRAGGSALAVVIACCLAVGAQGVGAAARARSTETPMVAPGKGFNVVLISIDSLRADHMSVHGYHRPTTPVLERWAADGVVFTRCWSTTSWTLPAHMSMLTGRSLLGHRVVDDERALGADVPTLAEIFNAAGYRTGAIVSAPYVESRYGFARGFEQYDDRTISFATNNESYKSVTAPLLIAKAEQWLETLGALPFFLFLHFWDVHYDYAPGPPYDTMFDPAYSGDIDGDGFYFNPKIHPEMSPHDLEHVVALYDGEIRLVDDHLGKLEDVLTRLGVSDRTVLVVTSDHGDEFFEHGRKGHHATLHEEVLHVPWILKIPGSASAGTRIDVPTSIVDIAPTILGFTGIPGPPMEGRDMLRHMEPESRPVFAELYRKGSLNVQVAARHGQKKIIHHFNRRLVEAYDLDTDAGEARPAGPRSATAYAMMPSLHRWLNKRWRAFARHEDRHGVARPYKDHASAEALRALGYVE